MDLRIFVEPQQGATYEDQLAVARAAEDLGFGAFFRSDHFLGMGTEGLPGPTDSWVTLGALARETTSIRLGTLVTSATFRHPGLLAVQVAQVDQMSRGRVELGIGAGWFEQEHAAYAVPFPGVPERFDRLEETLEILTGLWTTQDRFSHDGTHFQVTDSPGLPKPHQSPHPPLIIIGGGKRRTPALAARFASEFNMPFSDVETTRTQFDRVREACERAGRDAEDLTRSNALVVCAGESEEEVRRRADAIGREPAELRDNGLAGSPDEIVDKLGRYAEVGSQRVYLQVLDQGDLDHLELLARRVLPQVAER